MKIKECLVEGAADNLFGTWTTPQKEPKEPKANKQEVQKGFLTKFLNGATTALNKAIEVGTVNPSLTDIEPNKAEPKQSTEPSNTAKWQPSSNEPSSAQQTIAAKKQFDKNIANSNTLKNAAKIALQKPGFQRTAQDLLNIKAAKQAGVDLPFSESKYAKLNRLFENIIEATETSGHQLSIYEYLKDWYDSYMRNINWNEHKSEADQLIKQVQTSYKMDKGKAALIKLGNFTYNLATKAREARRKAQLDRANDFDGYEYNDEKFSPVGNSGDIVADAINTQLERLMKTNPHAYQQAIKMLDANLDYRNSQL